MHARSMQESFCSVTSRAPLHDRRMNSSAGPPLAALRFPPPSWRLLPSPSRMIGRALQQSLHKEAGMGNGRRQSAAG